MKLRLARRAYTDLDEIRTYSRLRWGTARTKRYLAAFDNVIKRACEAPYVFPELADRPTHRKANAGQHFIIFRVDYETDVLNVVRILHERMDIDAQLDS